MLIKKIIRSSISDIVCKGVKPKYIFISGSGNKNHFNKKNLKLISKSIKEEQKKYNIKLSGGDTAKSKFSSFTVVSLGLSKKIIKRSNVSVDEDIYVTGDLGDNYMGLGILNKKININSKLKNYFIKKYFLPDIPIKLSKYLQHSNLDVPTIGIKTLKQIKQYNYEGVFIEKNNCVILEKEKMIDYCNENNLFLSTLNKIEK